MNLKSGILYFFSGLALSCSSIKEQESVKEYPIETMLELESSVLGVSVVADSLEVPWDIVWGPDGCIWLTEQSGVVSRLDLKTGERHQLLVIDEVWRKRTTGLLGLALHPDMAAHPYVFLNYTAREGQDSTIVSKLVRYEYKGDALINGKELVKINGNTAHNGSRLAFTKSGELLWATGDAYLKGAAQDSTSLNGKILRLNIDGTVPADNPIKGSYIWAWGFRNMQGLAVAGNGNIYTSEHGDAIEDEINLILPLHNYGWPEIEGYHDQEQEMAIAATSQRSEPIKSWTPTVAPAGIDLYVADVIPEWSNSILLTTLKGKSLRVLQLSPDGKSIIGEGVYLESKYGRLRDVCVSPAGDVYIATSNRDWNPSPGFPVERDDRILRISKVDIAKHLVAQVAEPDPAAQQAVTGDVLYKQYCASCHKEDGSGVLATFPPLKGAEQVLGDKDKLLPIVLHGLTGPIVVNGENYDQAMPAFSFLTDAQVASITTYIRSSWGNNASAILEEDVRKNRKK